jgi:hypothetical protein
MGPLRELLATDQRQALEFFALRLADISGPAVEREELLYHASILAHHALISTQADIAMSAPANLSAVFDHFVLGASLVPDRGMMETAGSQCLLLAGFFEDQMRRRHDIRWYAELGAAFFIRAAALEPSPPKARQLQTVARHFEPWRRRYARLSREIRDQPYLLDLPTPPDHR